MAGTPFYLLIFTLWWRLLWGDLVSAEVTRALQSAACSARAPFCVCLLLLALLQCLCLLQAGPAFCVWWRRWSTSKRAFLSLCGRDYSHIREGWNTGHCPLFLSQSSVTQGELSLQVGSLLAHRLLCSHHPDPASFHTKFLWSCWWVFGHVCAQRLQQM